VIRQPGDSEMRRAMRDAALRQLGWVWSIRTFEWVTDERNAPSWLCG
jgi:hypothetical protein